MNKLFTFGNYNTAKLSVCGLYRYELTRCVQTFGVPIPFVVVMLNPSTADAFTDDATIKSLKRIAAFQGFSHLIVYNLYAYRATKPIDLWKAADPIGPGNKRLVTTIHNITDNVLCAWGSNAEPERAKKFCHALNVLGVKMWCLDVNKNGSPKHPLYCKASTELKKFDYTAIK